MSGRHSQCVRHGPRMDYCQSPIFATHLACMRAAKSASSRAQFQADRANMRWITKEIGLLFSQCHMSEILQRLHLLKGHGGVDTASGLSKLSDEQLQNAAAFWRLTVCVAGERSWHMLHHTFTFPEGFAGLLSDDAAERHSCLARVRRAAELITAAESALLDAEHDDRVATRTVFDSLVGTRLAFRMHELHIYCRLA